MKRALYYFLHTIIIVLCLSCSSSNPTEPADNAVMIRDNAFDPPLITVGVGRMVVWRHLGSNQHTVTSGTPTAAGRIFESGVINPGGLYSFTFSQAGSYAYFCRIHGPSMSGTIQVR